MNGRVVLTTRTAWLTTALALVALALAPGPVRAAAPPPCGGVPQIVDTTGGHHPGTDVLSAWFSEATGPLQAVIRVEVGSWVPEHDDKDIDLAGYAVLWELGGRTAFVRVQVTTAGVASYDYGSFDGTRLHSEGATTGAIEYAPFGGTATIDVPAATGAVAGARLARPFALTYDGTSADGLPHWVDQAPGFEQPGDAARGTDYVVGSCLGGTPSGDSVLAVELKAPQRIRGGGTVRVTGRLVPALAGVRVVLSKRDRRTRTIRLTTGANGRFATRLSVHESTRLRAVADGVASATIAVRVASVVKLRARQLRSGAVRVLGSLRPALPGRLLLLGAAEVEPERARKVSGRRFTFRFGPGRLAPGRYQVVYIPRAGLAERSTSNTVRVRR